MQMNRRNSLRISDEVANIDFSKYVRFSEAVTSKMFHSQCTDSWTVGESMEMFPYRLNSGNFDNWFRSRSLTVTHHGILRNRLNQNNELLEYRAIS